MKVCDSLPMTNTSRMTLLPSSTTHVLNECAILAKNVAKKKKKKTGLNDLVSTATQKTETQMYAAV